MAYILKIKEIADLFDEDLVLTSKSHKKLEKDPDVLVEGRHTVDTKIGESFGIELRYKAEKAGDFVSVYVVLQYRINSLGRPYPHNFIVAADFEIDRLNDFFDAYDERDKVSPFLFIETTADSNKRTRFDDISKLNEGTTLQELTNLLYRRYCTA
ncbi:MAG: hypothetical protein ABIH63_04030 [archaeon]